MKSTGSRFRSGGRKNHKGKGKHKDSRDRRAADVSEDSLSRVDSRSITKGSDASPAYRSRHTGSRSASPRHAAMPRGSPSSGRRESEDDKEEDRPRALFARPLGGKSTPADASSPGFRLYQEMWQNAHAQELAAAAAATVSSQQLAPAVNTGLDMSADAARLHAPVTHPSQQYASGNAAFQQGPNPNQGAGGVWPHSNVDPITGRPLSVQVDTPGSGPLTDLDEFAPGYAVRVDTPHGYNSSTVSPLPMRMQHAASPLTPSVYAVANVHLSSSPRDASMMGPPAMGLAVPALHLPVRLLPGPLPGNAQVPSSAHGAQIMNTSSAALPMGANPLVAVRSISGQGVSSMAGPSSASGAFGSDAGLMGPNAGLTALRSWSDSNTGAPSSQPTFGFQPQYTNASSMNSFDFRSAASMSGPSASHLLAESKGPPASALAPHRTAYTPPPAPRKGLAEYAAATGPHRVYGFQVPAGGSNAGTGRPPSGSADSLRQRSGSERSGIGAGPAGAPSNGTSSSSLVRKSRRSVTASTPLERPEPDAAGQSKKQSDNVFRRIGRKLSKAFGSRKDKSKDQQPPNTAPVVPRMGPAGLDDLSPRSNGSASMSIQRAESPVSMSTSRRRNSDSNLRRAPGAGRIEDDDD